MASSVGCWTSSSKVGRSGFLSFSHHITCEDVLRLIRLYLHLSSVLLDCIFARVAVFYRYFPTIIYTDAFLRVFVGFLGFFIWCIGRECAVRSTLHDVFHQLLIRVRTRASVHLHSSTSLRFSFFNYRRLSAVFGRRCAAVVGGPDALGPIVAVSSAGKVSG